MTCFFCGVIMDNDVMNICVQVFGSYMSSFEYMSRRRTAPGGMLP